LLDAYVDNRTFFNSLLKKEKISVETRGFINEYGDEILKVYAEVSIDYFRALKCNELLEKKRP